MRRLDLLTALCFAAAAVWGHSIQARANTAPDDTFQQANSAFESKDYGKAISLYESLVRKSYAADSLYLNLGTAHYRNGSPGRAALWYRRAACLNPGMAEIRQNFEFLRRQLGILEFAGDQWRQTLLRRSPALLGWGAWLLFWASLFIVGSLFFGKNLQSKPLLVVLLIFAAIGSAGFFWIGNYRAKHLAPENFATVVVPGTSALAAPAPDSAAVIALPEGSEVRILQDTGPWLYAEVPGKLVGWVHHTSVEKNWPIPES